MPDTFFPQQSGSTVAQSPDFVKDSFSDYSLAATNNTSLTSTVSTNPKNDFFANTDSPRFSAKTLRIKDLIVEDDSSKWVNGAKTYRIVFYDQDPNFQAYAYGNISLVKYSDTKVGLVVNSATSGVGISGVVRKAGFICNTSIGTATARIYVDGAFVSSNDYGGQGLYTDGATVGYDFSAFEPYKQHVIDSGSIQTNNIHNYEIRADVVGTAPGNPGIAALTILGVIVYCENATQNVECPPGVSYVDKSKVTTTSGNALTIPALNASLFHLGSKTSFFKTSAGPFGASLFQVPLMQSTATGLSGTNLVSTGLNQGQSYPIGTGINIQTGSSNYIGIVTSQSTDTLTVNPTLVYGVAGGTLTKLFYASSTASISATTFYKAWTWDPVRTFGQIQQGGPLGLTTGQGAVNVTLPIFVVPFVQHAKMFMVEPICNNVTTSQLPLVNSVAGVGGWRGPFRISGDAQALEVEMFIGTSGIVSGTFTIDGFNAYGISLASGSTTGQTTSIFKLPISTEMGIGWHTLKFESNAGSTNYLVTAVNGYKYRGPSTAPGYMSSVEQTQSFVDGISVDKNFLGTNEIIPASQMYLKGGWGAQFRAGRDILLYSSFKGYFFGLGFSSNSFTDPNSVMRTEFYGNRFCIHGTLFASSSFLVSLNGASFGAPFNTVVSTGTTDGFNIVTVTRQVGTLAISALSYGKTYNDMVNAQNFNAIPSLLELPGSQIKENSISVRKAQRRFYGFSVGIGGFALSDRFDSATLLYAGGTYIQNLRVAIATSGNPVSVGLMTGFNRDVAGDAGIIQFGNISGAVSCIFTLARYLQSDGFNPSNPTSIPGNPAGVLQVASTAFLNNLTTSGEQLSMAPSSVFTPCDIAPAGNYIYILNLNISSVTTVVQFFNTRLFAYEIF